MKRGDRVRVMFEGVLMNLGEDSLSVETDGGDSRWFSKHSYSHDTFQIERIEPPLSVGSRARIPGGSRPYEIVFERDGVFFGISKDNVAWAGPASDWERIA